MKERQVAQTVLPDQPRYAGRLTFEAGFACALACLVRDYDQLTMAANIARDNGVTLKMMREAGTDPADLKTLRGHIG